MACVYVQNKLLSVDGGSCIHGYIISACRKHNAAPLEYFAPITSWIDFWIDGWIDAGVGVLGGS